MLQIPSLITCNIQMYTIHCFWSWKTIGTSFLIILNTGNMQEEGTCLSKGYVVVCARGGHMLVKGMYITVYFPQTPQNHKISLWNTCFGEYVLLHTRKNLGCDFVMNFEIQKMSSSTCHILYKLYARRRHDCKRNIQQNPPSISFSPAH